MEPEEARRRLYEGGVMLCMDVPQGLHFPVQLKVSLRVHFWMVPSALTTCAPT